MSRRTRRARRHLRRGAARHEALLLVGDDRRALIEWAELLGRVGYRYRSELLPIAHAIALLIIAAILHGNQVAAWWVSPAVLPVAGGVCWPRVAPLLRPIERGYVAAVAVLSGTWLTAATAYGPGTAPLPLLLGVGTAVAGVPWWAHRRRRAKVRVERTLDAWPDITAAVGLPGTRIMSAVVDRWGWRARVGLPPGKTATDLINSTSALESGLHTRPGAVRVEPDPDRADHAVIRVLTTDPHDHPIPYPTDRPTGGKSVTDPIPLGLFEDARQVTLRLAHRHGLLGGVAGAGKSGVLNVILAELVACPDVVLWGIDLKGGMELQPWQSCLGRLATTPADAAALLADAVTILESRAHQMAESGARLWTPTPTRPALIVVVDEYAELADDAPTALGIADSIARRGRAVAVTLLAATQRPTQKAMGSGAVRSQMDVRICLRVRERRDVDLILGQGMLVSGWAADTLNAPGKFFLSDPEHTTPRRARAYRVDDQAVAAIAARHAERRPQLDPPGPEREAAPVESVDDVPDSDAALLAALESGTPDGCSVKELITATGMGRTWVYSRLQEHAAAGRVIQITRGRWVITTGQVAR